MYLQAKKGEQNTNVPICTVKASLVPRCYRSDLNTQAYLISNARTGRFGVDLIGLIIQLSDLLIYFALYASQIHLFRGTLHWRVLQFFIYLNLSNESCFTGMIKFGFLSKLVL